MHGDQVAKQLVPRQRHVDTQIDAHPQVVLGCAEAEYAGNAGYDDDIPPGKYGTGGRMAHLVDHVVDRGVLLDIGVRTGDVSFGLVIVVIADKILDGVFGKELSELLKELGRQGLVGCDHNCRPILPGNHVCHCKGLAGSGDAQQHLIGTSRAQPAAQTRDRLGLVAFGGEVGNESKGTHAPPDRPIRATHIAAMPSSRPTKPNPSVVVAFTLTRPIDVSNAAARFWRISDR